MLQHNTLNKQYLSLWKRNDSDRIRGFFEQFLHRFQPSDGYLPFVVCASRADHQTVETWADQLDIQIDLPLGKYHLAPPTETYVTFLYVEDGSRRKGHRPSEPVAHGRGLNLIEGLAMAAVWPEVLEDHAIDLIDSRYSVECVPTLYRWDNQTHLSAVCPDVQDTMCGAPVVKYELKFDRQGWADLTDEYFQAQLQRIMA